MNANKRSEHRKTDRRWTQIYADKMEFLRLPQRVLASFKPVAKSHRLGPASCHNQHCRRQEIYREELSFRPRSEPSLSAFICGSALSFPTLFAFIRGLSDEAIWYVGGWYGDWRSRI